MPRYSAKDLHSTRAARQAALAAREALVTRSELTPVLSTAQPKRTLPTVLEMPTVEMTQEASDRERPPRETIMLGRYTNGTYNALKNK